MRYVEHTFRPTETIDAVMRLLGRHNYTKEEIIELRVAFAELNGPVIPKPGMVFKIPLQEPIEVPLSGSVPSNPEGS